MIIVNEGKKWLWGYPTYLTVALKTKQSFHITAWQVNTQY